ncbi:unknown [Firmicutes bacterium CAG:460]|jgi:hypothetical protein|uniref:hypothetical protein n=1 Tax=Candidatus Onthocola sp. TaxID=3085646 RepID=UPI00033DC6AC|nr:hypothetical protein [Bacillota bacterium]CDE49745.1 unknown [Firmicutes bacterium CAG:460]
MEKLKINTVSGNVLEKPIVTAFKSNGGEYVVLDNEMNGTMGLPIILVSKLENGSLVIVPDSEWNAVKEALRLIISGNQMEYVNVGNVLSSEDTFFKQLTLPVASFEALKNSYKPVVHEEVTLETPEVNVEPVVQATPVQTPEVVESPIVMNDAPVAPQMPEASAPVAPIMPEAPVEAQSVAEVPAYTEKVAPMPSVEEIPEEHDDVPVDFTADKEAFLKACENMFDALVAKFNK